MDSHRPETADPRVSVGLPVYNGEAFLEEAIRSILSQEFDDLELIVSDNGSTDDTEEICRELATRDQRLRYHRRTLNEGAAANYNRTFRMARGELFKWAAHDDVCLPGFLGRCVDALDTTPKAVLAYTRSRFIGSDGGDLGEDTDRMEVRGASAHHRLRRCLATVNMAAPVFGVIRSDALRRTRLIDRFVASDYVLLAELAMLGEFAEVPEGLFLRRVHAGSSREANKTDRQVLQWFDPSKRRVGLLSVRQRLMLEYSRSCHRLVEPVPERLLCLATVPTTMGVQRARVVGGRWKRVVGRRLLRAPNGGVA